MSRWTHDRTGERVELDDDRAPRTSSSPVKTRTPMFEIFASWIDTETGRIEGATRGTANRADVRDICSVLRAEHGHAAGFTIDVDVIDEHGRRRTLTNGERPTRDEAIAAITAIRETLRPRPKQQTEAF